MRAYIAILVASLLAETLAQEYYCPNNNDGCDWEVDRSKKFCYKIFHGSKNFASASRMCEAYCLEDCQSELLEVGNVEPVARSLLQGGVRLREMLLENGTRRLRVQAVFQDGSWVDSTGTPAEFPLGYGNTTDQPYEAINLPGYTASVDFLSGTVFGDTDKTDEIAYICQSCVTEIPICPDICENCNDEMASTALPSTTTWFTSTTHNVEL